MPKEAAASTIAAASRGVARRAFMASERRDLLQRVGDDRPAVVRGGSRGQEHPVLEHRWRELLDVVRQSVIAATYSGERLRGAEEEQRGPWAGAELDSEVLASCSAERTHVAGQRLGPV